DNSNGTWSWSQLGHPSDSGTVTITATNADGAASITTFNLSFTALAVTSIGINAGTAPVLKIQEIGGGLVTVTTDGPHHFSGGDPVLLAGIGSGYDGSYTVQAAGLTANTFNIALANTGRPTVAKQGTATDTALTDSGLLVNGTAGGGHSASFH